jgi:hypothetical protein
MVCWQEKEITGFKAGSEPVQSRRELEINIKASRHL